MLALYRDELGIHQPVRHEGRINLDNLSLWGNRICRYNIRVNLLHPMCYSLITGICNGFTHHLSSFRSLVAEFAFWDHFNCFMAFFGLPINLTRALSSANTATLAVGQIKSGNLAP